MSTYVAIAKWIYGQILFVAKSSTKLSLCKYISISSGEKKTYIRLPALMSLTFAFILQWQSGSRCSLTYDKQVTSTQKSIFVFVYLRTSEATKNRYVLLHPRSFSHCNFCALLWNSFVRTASRYVYVAFASICMYTTTHVCHSWQPTIQ